MRLDSGARYLIIPIRNIFDIRKARALCGKAKHLEMSFVRDSGAYYLIHNYGYIRMFTFDKRGALRQLVMSLISKEFCIQIYLIIPIRNIC